MKCNQKNKRSRFRIQLKSSEQGEDLGIYVPVSSDACVRSSSPNSLKKAGVRDKVIAAMMERASAGAATPQASLLPPASSDATSSSGRIGEIYSFRIIE